MKDTVFNSDSILPGGFKFDHTIANAFDDMADRSIPFYQVLQHMIGAIVTHHAAPNTTIYDLGCATGTTLKLMESLPLPPDVQIIGIDNSEPMLAKCKEKLATASRPITLENRDLNHPTTFPNACVTILHLTLQFIAPENRDQLIQSIYTGLQNNGCLILIEKVLCENPAYDDEFIDHYYQFKKDNGYSELEIAKKRDALENVLQPLKTSDNVALLKQNGFTTVEIFFKWFNFVGIIAVK